MKTKIGIPFGLALVMFIGVFTTMLALGVMAPSGVQGAEHEFDVAISNTIPGHYSDWSFTVDADTGFSGGNVGATPVTLADTIGITFPTDFTLGGATGTPDTGTHAAANWQLGVDADGKAIAPKTVGVTSQVVTLTAAADMKAVDAGKGIKVKFTSPTKGLAPTTGAIGIVNPVATSTNRTDVALAVTVSVTGASGTTAVTSDEDSETFSIDTTRVGQVEVTNDPTAPGSENAEYQISFYAPESLTANQDRIIVRFDKDITDPPSISENHVRINSSLVTGTGNVPGNAISLTDAPTHTLVNSMGRAGDDPGDKNIAEYKLRVPDLDTDPDRAQAGIDANGKVIVTFSSSAGFKNPTESGTSDVVSVATSKQSVFVSDNISVPLILEIDDVKDKRDTPLTITGRGFHNGTTAIIWVEKHGEDYPNNTIGVKDDNEIGIIPVEVGSDDTFEVTVSVVLPPFVKGAGNYINAIDGEEPTANTFTDIDRLPQFEVEQSILISPASANVGDTVRVQVRDWPVGGSIPRVERAAGDNRATDTGPIEIAGVKHGPTVSAAIDDLGNATFDIVIQNEVPVGTRELRLDFAGSNAEAKIVIGGADLTVNPSIVVPNQSVLVTGRGFTRNGTINRGTVNGNLDISSVSLGGNTNGLKAKDGVKSRTVNADEVISVDSGGNWSANIVVPMTSTSIVPSASTSPSVQELKITDSGRREGIVSLTIAPRSLTISPPASRVGTEVTVTGEGFPANNPAEEAEAVPIVNIEYNVGGTNPWRRVGSVSPDSSGNFTTTFTVPTTAVLPSDNTVRAQFTVGTIPYESTTVHGVPEGGITLSVVEGVAGREVEVTGEGFKSFRGMEEMKFGIVEVTPSPKPITNDTGGFTARFVVPGLEVGSHNVEVTISETVASAPFRILEADTEPMMPGMMPSEAMAPAMAYAAVIAEDNLITVYHFDPATQSEAPNFGWTLYDARPLFMGGNNLDMVNPGGFYFVEVSENQMGVTLGGRTMDLYAGLNPIVW